MMKHKLYNILLSKQLAGLLVDYFKRNASSIIHYSLLIIIISLALYVNFIPHTNYKLPLHVDEWRHFAESQEILKEQNFEYSEPYFGEWANEDLEIGFHIFLASYKEVSGIDWVTLFVYMPAIIFMFTTLSTYVLARRIGFGLEAAFIMIFLPTNVRMLGPSLLVPVSLGIFFFVLSFFLIFFIKTRSAFITILMVFTYLFLMHPPSAIIALMAIFPYLLLSAIENKKLRILMVLTGLIFLLLINLKFYSLALSVIDEILSPGRPWLPFLPEVFKTFGYLLTLLFIIGIFFLTLESSIENRSLILASITLLSIIILFVRVTIATEITEIIYSRTYLYFTALMSIIGGFGLWKLRLNLEHVIKKVCSNRSILASSAIFGLFVAVILYSSVTDRMATPYYHVIDYSDYENFVWIKENLDGQKAILDTWKAIAFTPVTGKQVYSRVPQWPSDNTRVQRTYAFLASGCADTAFLRDNNISIVYANSCSNPELEKVREKIYVVK